MAAAIRLQRQGWGRRSLPLQGLGPACDSMDSSPPGSSVHGILQARILEWVAISSSKGSSQPRDQTHVSCGFCIARGFFIPELPGKPQWKYQSWSMSPTEIDRNVDMWLLRLDQNRQCIFHLSDTHYQEGWPLSHCCCCLVSKSCPTLWDLSPWDSPGKHTGVGSHSLFRGFSQPKDRTWVSCIESRFFAIWATREPLVTMLWGHKKAPERDIAKKVRPTANMAVRCKKDCQKFEYLINNE